MKPMKYDSMKAQNPRGDMQLLMAPYFAYHWPTKLLMEDMTSWEGAGGQGSGVKGQLGCSVPTSGTLHYPISDSHQFPSLSS